MRRRRIGCLWMVGLCLAVLTLGTGRPAKAATITVTNINDNGAGSLRQAIADANVAGGDTITFALDNCPCTIILLNGALVIDKHLTIEGPGATSLTIHGRDTSRVFEVSVGVVAQLSGLRMIHGRATDGGGAIQNRGTLTVLDSIVAESQSKDSGGGIESNGPLTVRNSRVVNNESTHDAGGILISSGPLTVIGSSISGNAAGSSAGGIEVLGSSQGATIISSTISNNVARSSEGGGIYSEVVPLTIVNSTISGNSAVTVGGGLYVRKGTLTLLSSTVTDNGRGGVATFDGSIINNTIVAGNAGPNVSGPIATLNNNLIDVDVATVLAPTLADNGGPTLTHALLPGSPAIGAGGNAWIPNDAFDLDGDGDTAELLPVDQRGVGFARQSGFTVDIGAVEAACSAITLSPATLPNPSVGAAYSQTLTATGGQGITGFSATGVPPGLTMSSDGILGGIATAAGTFTVTVTATDELGCAGTQTYTLTIADQSCGIVIGPATLKTPYLATLYYQPLSVTPSSQYGVTVSAGALPHGVYLFAIGRSWFLGGIPTTPGEYTFTLAATKPNSPCVPTRTFTVIVPATVLPQLTCVAKTGGKQYTAHFGYDNSTDAAVTIPVGTDNYFTPGAQDRGQVTTFQTGRVTNAFSVVFTVKNNHTDLALWYLRGPDGVRRPVNITTATSRCP